MKFLQCLSFVIVVTHRGSVFGLSLESRERIIADAVICEPHKHGAKIPNPVDCSSFYVCDRGIPELMLCDAGLFFDIHLKVCNWPEQTTCVYGLLPEKPSVGQESENNSSGFEPAIAKPMPHPAKEPNDLDSSISAEGSSETPVLELSKPVVVQPIPESEDKSNEQPAIENSNQHPSQEELLPFPVHPVDSELSQHSGEGVSLPIYITPEQEFPEQKPKPAKPAETKPFPENSSPEPESKPFENFPTLIPNTQDPFVPFITIPQEVDSVIIYLSRVECKYDGTYYLPHETTCEHYYICVKGSLHENYCGSNLYWDYIKERCEAPQVASCYSQLAASGSLVVVPGTPGWGQTVPISNSNLEGNNHHSPVQPDDVAAFKPGGNSQDSTPEQHFDIENNQHQKPAYNQRPEQAGSVENSPAFENQGRPEENSNIIPTPFDPLRPSNLQPIIPGGILFPHPEQHLPTTPPTLQNTNNPATGAVFPLTPKPSIVRPPTTSSLSSLGMSAKHALSSASQPHPMDGYDPEHVRCIHEGIYFLPHPTNCEIYFICINHTMHLHRCGYNIHWDYIVNQCSAPAPHRCYAFRDNVNVEEETESSPVKQPKPKDPMKGYDTEYIRCIHSGFYYLPHPTSCAIYFVCSNYTLNVYQCNTGSSWDYTEEQCSNLHNKCYSKSAQTTLIASKPTTVATTTTVEEEHDLSEVMEGYDPSRIHCLHNGSYYLPHPALCELYFMCANRTLSLHECSRPTLWNYRFERCDLPQKSTCFDLSAFVDSGEDEETTSPSPSPTTTTTTTTTTPAPTTTTSTSTTKSTTTTTTPKPKTTVSVHMPFDVDDKDPNAADDGLDILPKCPRHQAFYPHSKDCRKYYICIGGVPILTKCPDNLYWDPQQRMCGLPSHTKCVINRKA